MQGGLFLCCTILHSALMGYLMVIQLNIRDRWLDSPLKKIVHASFACGVYAIFHRWACVWILWRVYCNQVWILHFLRISNWNWTLCCSANTPPFHRLKTWWCSGRWLSRWHCSAVKHLQSCLEAMSIDFQQAQPSCGNKELQMLVYATIFPSVIYRNRN